MHLPLPLGEWPGPFEVEAVIAASAPDTRSRWRPWIKEMRACNCIIPGFYLHLLWLLSAALASA